MTAQEGNLTGRYPKKILVVDDLKKIRPSMKTSSQEEPSKEADLTGHLQPIIPKLIIPRVK